jgi:hypothetical protein
MAVADLFFKIFMVMVMADHWTSCIFHVAIGPIAKINFTINYTHLYYLSGTMDDNAKKKKAARLIPAMILTLTHNQEGEILYPFNMEDKIFFIVCLVHTALLKANFMMPLSNFIPIVPAALQG